MRVIYREKLFAFKNCTTFYDGELFRISHWDYNTDGEVMHSIEITTNGSCIKLKVPSEEIAEALIDDIQNQRKNGLELYDLNDALERLGAIKPPTYEEHLVGCLTIHKLNELSVKVAERESSIYLSRCEDKNKEQQKEIALQLSEAALHEALQIKLKLKKG